MNTRTCTAMIGLGVAMLSAQDEAKTIAPMFAASQDTPLGVMMLSLTHDSEHYGNVVTYLWLKDVVPPSAQPSR